jgi:cytochrome P450
VTCPAGPRLCLGQRLAELEGVFVLTGLLARFRFRQAVPGTTVTYNLSPTMPMKEGLMVVPEARV